MIHRTTCFLAAILIGGLSYATAQDWPQWRGPNRDGKAAGFTAPAAWPKELTQKWQAKVGLGCATPALVGDKLYVFTRQGAEEVILCLDAQTGKEIWKDHYAAQAVTGPASPHPGPRSTPAVADGKIVTLGVGGVVSCLDAATGKLLWRNEEYSKVVPAFYTSSSPMIVDGLCVVHLGGKGNGALLACDLATGNVKWKCTGEGPGYGSPVLLNAAGVKQIVTLTEKSVIGVSLADGKLLWQLPFTTQGRQQNATTPIVDDQTVIFTGQGRGTKAIRVEKTADGFTAKEVWSNMEMAAGFNSPVLKDGLIFGMSDAGKFFCMSAKDGKVAWTDSVVRDRFLSLLDAGSVLLALPTTSEMIVIKPGDKQYEEVAKIKVAPTQTYASLVVSGKRIFVKDQDTVTLWTVE